jgi:hypothetical protein
VYSQEIDDWSFFDIRDLKELANKGVALELIAHKLRRSSEDVSNKMTELGLNKKEPEVLMVPKTIKHKYDGEKKAPSFIDEDDMIRKDHDLRATQTQLLKEIVSSLQNHTLQNKDILLLTKENIKLQEEFLIIAREQHAVWKQKQTPPPTPEKA